MILPLAWVIERAGNGRWHVGWAVSFHEYSPGLVSSILMWVNFYFVVRTIQQPNRFSPAYGFRRW
jgi:hypothetical protein